MEYELATGYGVMDSVEWDGDDSIGHGEEKIALVDFSGIFGSVFGQVPFDATIHGTTLTYVVFNPRHPANGHAVLFDCRLGQIGLKRKPV